MWFGLALETYEEYQDQQNHSQYDEKFVPPGFFELVFRQQTGQNQGGWDGNYQEGFENLIHWHSPKIVAYFVACSYAVARWQVYTWLQYDHHF